MRFKWARGRGVTSGQSSGGRGRSSLRTGAMSGNRPRVRCRNGWWLGRLCGGGGGDDGSSGLGLEVAERGEERLREGGERLDDVVEDVERDASADGEGGLLEPLARLRADGVGAGEALAVGDEGEEAGLGVIGARVRGGARHLGHWHGGG